MVVDVVALQCATIHGFELFPAEDEPLVVRWDTCIRKQYAEKHKELGGVSLTFGGFAYRDKSGAVVSVSA